MRNEEEILKATQNLEKCIMDISEQLNKRIDKIEDRIEKKINNLKIKVDISKSIQNIENEIKNESKERKYQIDKLNSLTEYDKIILKNLESRIAILEEETENYNWFKGAKYYKNIFCTFIKK